MDGQTRLLGFGAGPETLALGPFQAFRASCLGLGTPGLVPTVPICGTSPGMAAPKNDTIPGMATGPVRTGLEISARPGLRQVISRPGPGKGDSAPLHHS
jgi:hypothetical protein